MEHAGGPEKLDRTPFEMAAKGKMAVVRLRIRPYMRSCGRP